MPGNVKRILQEKRARKRAPKERKGGNEIKKDKSQMPEARSYRPNPADCIDCREISAVDAIPCMRSLKSSAFEAFSSAVS
jgi:hypothetical protein